MCLCLLHVACYPSPQGVKINENCLAQHWVYREGGSEPPYVILKAAIILVGSMALRMTTVMTIKTVHCNACYVMQKPINWEFREIVSLLDPFFCY